MKKLSFFSFALAALALGACSSDNIDDLGSSGKGFGSDGNGYMKLSINLPTRSGSNFTRANDDTQDGELFEYEVKDATLILFGSETDNPNNATFKAAYDMNLTFNDEPTDNDQITSQASKVQKIGVISDANIYALVVLNRNGVFTVGADNTLKFGSENAFSGNFVDFTKKTVGSESSFTTTGFFMTNAPVVDKPGNAPLTSPTTTILVPVKNNIFKTENEAENSPAADIMVERAVAKVDVEPVSGFENTSINAGVNLTYSLAGWELANKNTSSYIVRNWNQDVSGTTLYGDGWYALASDGDGLTITEALNKNPYRFAGFEKIKEDDPHNPVSNYYRTYFGIDPNYSSDASFDNSGLQDAAAFQTENTKYCLENTFDVARQSIKNTTCAIIKIKFNLPADWGSANFYTVNGNTDKIYNEVNAKNEIAKKATELYGDKIKAEVEQNDEWKGKVFTIKATEVELEERGADGQVKAKSVKFVVTDAGGSVQPLDRPLDGTELAELNKDIIVTEYENAYSYYTVPIKHFGDDLTPWNKENKTIESYPGGENAASANWLGRYGVLRNNWYKLTLNSVKKIGSAVVPDIKNDATLDDNINNYVSLKVNVLSWAVRNQGIDLE